jgi:hypothetical protein
LPLEDVRFSSQRDQDETSSFSFVKTFDLMKYSHYTVARGQLSIPFGNQQIDKAR